MLCPRFTIFSALFWLSFIQIGVFVTELVLGGVQPTSFLAANVSTLEAMGQKVSSRASRSNLLVRLQPTNFSSLLP